MIAQLYLLQAHCQLTGRLLKAAQKYIVSLKQPRCHLFAKVVKLIRMISVALSCCIQFIYSCFRVVFNTLWVSSFAFLLDIKTGENPSSASACFHLHAGGRTQEAALQLTEIAEKLISSHAGQRSLLETFFR